jgi:L-malate glycosyltransferase
MITVIMATRNRAKVLRDVLDSYCCLHPPTKGWKLIVVDNASTDETSQVLSLFKGRLPLCSVFEPEIGKNSALNAGLEKLEGDLAVFTDDDAFPDPNWLVKLREAADANPSYTMFGGEVKLRWTARPPEWVYWLELGPIFTQTDPSLKEGPLPPTVTPMGPNMAIRSKVFKEGMRFDPSIGPRGDNYPMGSETEFLLRLSRSGHTGWHVKGAIVEHLVRQEQVNMDWVLRRAFRWGRGLHRMYPVKLWLGIPRHLYRDIPKELICIAFARLTFRLDHLLQARWRLNTLLGKAIEARIMKKKEQSHPQPDCHPVEGQKTPVEHN